MDIVSAIRSKCVGPLGFVHTSAAKRAILLAASLFFFATTVAFLEGCNGIVSTTPNAPNSGGTNDPTAPVIATQPVSQTVAAGQSATFVVAANGSTPLSYQWQKNGMNISGATSSSYTTPAATTSDNAAKFTVVVSNSAGTATSNIATLTVTAAQQGAPQIITQPASQTVTAGEEATFTVSATGSPTLTYQWQKNHVNIAGATSASYTTPVTATSDSGETFDV